MAARGSQIIREHDELSLQVSSLVDRKNRLERQLERRRKDIQEKQTAFANIAPRMEAERNNYRSASLKRAEAQKQYDEIQGQCWPLIERRDEARKGDEKLLRPFKRKLDRAQRAYERALERREQAKQRHDSAKSMEGFAAITAVTDTVRSFGGDASTRSMKQFQRSVSQGNYADASNASAIRAMELEEAEEAVILAQEDLEDAAEEYEEQQGVLVESRREIEDAGNRAEALVNGFVMQMMNSDRIIACAERAIDDLDELSQQTHLLEEAAKDEEDLSNALNETEVELVSTREQLAAIEDGASAARKRRRVRRIVLGVLAAVAVVTLVAVVQPFFPAPTEAAADQTTSTSTQTIGANSAEAQTDSAATVGPAKDLSKISDLYNQVMYLTSFDDFPYMSTNHKSSLDHAVQSIEAGSQAIGYPAHVEVNEYGQYGITLHNVLGSEEFTRKEIETYLRLLGIKEIVVYRQPVDDSYVPGTIASGNYIDSFGTTCFWTFALLEPDEIFVVIGATG